MFDQILPQVQASVVHPNSCVLCFSLIDITNAYDIQPLAAAGITGSGAIGLAEECDSSFGTDSQYQSDLNSFDTAQTLPSLTIHFVGNGSSTQGNTCTASPSWGIETDLDVQAAHSLAPSAPIYVCLDGPSSPSAGNCDLLFNQNRVAWGIKVVSNSFTYGSDWFATGLQYLAAAGVTVVSASGDTGTGQGIVYPAADVNNIAVGGTWFTPSEKAWGQKEWCGDWSAGSGCGSSGGGCSSTDNAPAGQTSMPGYSCSGSHRGYPDVSAIAGDFPVFVGGAETDGVGTSLSAPLVGAMIDLIQEATGYPGPYNQYIYKWAEADRHSQFIHDITAGNNNNGLGYYDYFINGWVPGSVASYASTGWDPVTGVGTLDVYGIASGWTFAGIYTGTSTQVSSVMADLTVPNDNPISGNNFEVFLGVYDSNHAYYMSGIAARNGIWGFFYGFTSSNCQTSVTPTWNAYTLTKGQTYTFRVYYSSSAVTMEIDLQGTTTAFASHSVTTSSTYLLLDSSGLCTDLYHNLLPGYALAEMVGSDYGNTFGTPIPTWNFQFAGLKFVNKAGTTTYNIDYHNLGSWSSSRSPSTDTIDGDGTPGSSISTSNPSSFAIDNQLFSASQSSTWIFVGRGHSGQVTGTVSNAWDCTSGCTVALATYQTIPAGNGVSLSISPTSGTVAFTYTVTVSATSTATCGTWQVGMRASSSSMIPNGYTSFRFSVSVTGCGGGGCVAAGSNVLTPSGWKKVETLALGDTIKEYYTGRGVLFTGVVLYNNASSVSQTLVINGGLLNLTLYDQPVFMQNATFTGWLTDPVNLTTSDQVWNALNSTWVNVTSIVVSHYATTVYDLVTSSENVFIDDGVLLDMKTH